jgi:hypothetical protein
MIERPYEFRRRLEVVHQPDRRDPQAQPEGDEVRVGESWTIIVSQQATPLVLGVAQDLQDYLLVSMGESVLVRKVDDVAAEAQAGDRMIVLGTRAALDTLGGALVAPRSYRLVCTPGRVVICGADERGVGQGSYYLEDLMNLRGAPFLRPQDVTRESIFSPRITHSGWALDEFPNAHLNAIAHAGMDAILIFVSGVDRTPDEFTHHRQQPYGGKYLDVNNLVERAARFGLDVYFYAYFRNMSPPHPDDPDAERWYDDTYGAIFRACPRAKGIILVGESVEFPSKDPHTSRTLRHLRPAGAPPPDKPTSGWWPAYDWVAWLELIKKVVRPHNPQADIVFWTYNWGYAPEADRLKLIHALPQDVSLLVTFEMFEPVTHNGFTNMCADYTLAFAGPGNYFASEARAAHERGLRLYTMANTGGLTWDVGVVPYEPAPYQWARRHEALKRAHDDWGLTGLMESHHFGWWPSFVSDLAKWNYWTPAPATEETLRAIARRDFGDGALPALAAWQLWSEAIQHYVATGHDQYGPLRIGPAYPLVFQEPAVLPVDWYAMQGARVAKTNYAPGLGRNQQLPEAQRLDVPTRVAFETRSFEQLAALWQQGVEHLAQAVTLAPAGKQAEARRQIGLAQFILRSVITTIHTKQWWLLKQALVGEANRARAEALLEQLAAVAEEEIANTEATIPLVAADSRLGWEPTMGYLGDAAHLRWKIAQVRQVLAAELPAYRAALAAGDAPMAARSAPDPRR